MWKFGLSIDEKVAFVKSKYPGAHSRIFGYTRHVIVDKSGNYLGSYSMSIKGAWSKAYNAVKYN